MADTQSGSRENARGIRQSIHRTIRGSTMANAGDTLVHPGTGERITFLETSAETRGAFTRLRLEVSPGGLGHAPHVHPRMDERFDILNGEWCFEVDGRARQVGAGDTVTIPAGAVHAWQTEGEGDAI